MICFRYEDIIHCRRFTICLFSFTILVARFKICLFISPELDGYRAYIHDIDRFQLERNYQPSAFTFWSFVIVKVIWLHFQA